MYESFFGLSARPFATVSSHRSYFPAPTMESARQSLARTIERAEGAGLLVGPAGTGKSLLLHLLAEQFRGRFAVAVMSGGHLATRRALLQAVLFELALPYRGMDEGELRLALMDFLNPSPRHPDGLLMLVDEADRLPLRLLEELRMITNVVRQGQPRARIVLAGGPQLEERFAHPRLEGFAQRLSARCYLSPLSKDETAGYIRHALSEAGGDPAQIMDEAALVSVYHATTGIPRLINQLCDHAMLLAFAGGVARIEASGIEEAWSDLQQLPLPYDDAPRAKPAVADTIEFGVLVDDDAEPTEAIKSDTRVWLELVASRSGDVERDDDTEEADYQPALARPEVELVFSDRLDPFGESFEDEEVIVERYAAADASFHAQRSVYSAEGATLASMLEPFVRPAAPRLAMEHESEEVVSPSEDFVSEEVVAEHEGWTVAPPEPKPEPKQTWNMAAVEPRDRLALPGSMSVQRESFSKPVHAEPAPAQRSLDHDMIIIEDEADETGVPAPARVARPAEYGRLFLQLRGQ